MKVKFEKIAFESLSSISQNVLVGGFSNSVGTNTTEEPGGGASNNCLGGNCTANCGAWQNVRCNTQSGCS